MIRFFWFFLFINATLSFAQTLSAPQSVPTTALKDFQANPAHIKRLIELGLELTKRKLAYTYGSADPNVGGMDCSGTMYYLLRQLGVASPPRSSNDLYQWIKNKGVFYSRNDLSHLHPGDLLFWTGTYSAPGNAYITHVMIYIGKNLQGEHLMLGSSNGRTYQGKKIYGVSVFDFLPPSNKDTKFVGYSCIPQISCRA